MNVALIGYSGKVGRALLPALERAGHRVKPIGRDDHVEVAGLDAAVDFTTPDHVFATVSRCLEQRVPTVVGTTGLGESELAELDSIARAQDVQLFVAPNFAIGAVLMMRFAAEAGRVLPRAEIVEAHHEGKKDAPSGTAKATAALLPGETPIHSIRLPGLVAHQEVVFGGEGQSLTIRHDTYSRDAFAPGVLLALEKLATLPPGLTLGLDALL